MKGQALSLCGLLLASSPDRLGAASMGGETGPVLIG